LKLTYEYFKSLPPDELYKKEHKAFEEYIRK
jgi:dTDP-glucose 4,6-dehydratase